MNMKPKSIKNVILYSLILFIALSAVFLTVISYQKIREDQTARGEIIQDDRVTLSNGRSMVSNEAYSVAADLMYLTDTYKTFRYDGDGKGTIERLWADFSSREKIYDQIRFIDAQGDEIIRINNKDGTGVPVEADQLQNKSDRYYFTETIVLSEGQIYISKLDLNIENGVIEKPDKPMIRLATPVYGRDNSPEGMVVVNYSAKYMLQYLKELAFSATGDMYLLNSNGYWLYNSGGPSKEWGFMYEDRAGESFAAAYPDAWDAMKNTGDGAVWSGDNCFVFNTVVPLGEQASYQSVQTRYPAVLGEGNWILVSHIHPGSDSGKVFFASAWDTVLRTAEERIFTILMIFAVSVFLAVLIRIRSTSSAQVKYFSEYDVMTGVLNRRAGMEFLKRARRQADQTGEKICICYADVNGLKEVNDRLGHEVGDELITGVVNVIQRKIRQTDFIIRLGGDEMLIVFRHSGAQDAEMVWKRITSEFESINRTEDRRYIVSVSHGIEEISGREGESLDNLINGADQKMYEEKKIMKKGFSAVKKE